VPVPTTAILSIVPPETVTIPVAPNPSPVSVVKLTDSKVPFEYPIPAFVILRP
jgi:hypothetical protein